MKLPKSGVGIGRRIGRLVASAVFTAVLFAALTLTLVQVNTDINASRESLKNTGYALAAAVADAVVNRNREEAMKALGSVSRIPNLRMVVLLDAKGTSLASLGQAAILNDDLASMDGSDASFLLKGTMPVAVDIIRGGSRVGRLVMLADITKQRTTFMLTLFKTLLSALAAAMVAVLFSRPLQKRIVKPVTALTEQISAIRDSRNYHAEIEVKNDFGEVGILVESFKRLMADVRQRDQSLQNLAYFDPMTGLPNRANLLHEVGVDRPEFHYAALALFDVHNYQSFAHAFGQTIADAVLLSAAAALHDNAGTAGVFRVGAHEFAVLFKAAAGVENIEADTARLMAVFIQPLVILRSEIKIDVDCGIVLADNLSPESIDGSILLRCASLALNEARKLGPNRTVFYKGEMKEKAQRDTRLAQDLRAAIAENRLEAHFQPQLDLKTGLISGFEALARWRHPELGEISPSVFVPVAEAHGLIGELGDWILDRSCQIVAEWQRATGTTRTISVNVSAAQFLESGFAPKVSRIADKHGLPLHLLCLEVTESIFISASVSEIRNTLQVLGASGIKLALDDFGTGYSSLGYLAKLPLNIIKIDRSFVTEAHRSERRKAILQSIIHMSHSIGLDVVAEGAETDEEIDLLKQLKVDKIQGFGVARPMVADAALAFAESWGKPSTAQLTA